jgi:hypothetical protein
MIHPAPPLSPGWVPHRPDTRATLGSLPRPFAEGAELLRLLGVVPARLAVGIAISARGARSWNPSVLFGELSDPLTGASHC